jgi:hypothetical protein
MFNFFKRKAVAKILCPHCSIQLEQFPSRKTKCKKCSQYIYVRTNPHDEQRILVTEAEAQKIDELWKVEASHSRWIRTVKDMGATDEDIQKTKDILRTRFGFEPPFRDVIWSLFNESSKRGDMPYYTMALFLDEEGRDPSKMLAIDHKMKLKQLKTMGVVKTVKILSAGDQSCVACKEHTDKIFTIEEATKNPVLPCKNCTYHMTENSKYGFCRCSYNPEEISFS